MTDTGCRLQAVNLPSYLFFYFSCSRGTHYHTKSVQVPGPIQMSTQMSQSTIQHPKLNSSFYYYYALHHSICAEHDLFLTQVSVPLSFILLLFSFSFLSSSFFFPSKLILYRLLLLLFPSQVLLVPASSTCPEMTTRN